MRAVLNAEIRLDALLAGLENQVLLASDAAVLEDCDAADVREVANILAGRFARHDAAGQAMPLDRGVGMRRRFVRSLLARAPVRSSGLSVAYSNDSEPGGEARDSEADSTKPE